LSALLFVAHQPIANPLQLSKKSKSDPSTTSIPRSFAVPLLMLSRSDFSIRNRKTTARRTAAMMPVTTQHMGHEQTNLRALSQKNII
jgi:hypothetical protein